MPENAVSEILLDESWSARRRILETLPRRWRAAFAVRCARRVQPLYDLPPDLAFRQNYFEMLAFALRTVENFAGGSDGQKPLQSARAAGAGAAGGTAHTVPSYAAKAVASAAFACADAHDADAAAATAEFAVDAAVAAAADFVSRPAGEDLSRLQSLLAEQRPGPDAALDPTEAGPLGPLWPFGVPQWYVEGKKCLDLVLGLPAPFRAPGPRQDEVLEISPFHREVLNDLLWAEAEAKRGTLPGKPGQYVAVVNREVKDVGFHVGEMMKRLKTTNPSVPRARYALYYLDPGDAA
jgi:hypothetical protein